MRGGTYDILVIVDRTRMLMRTCAFACTRTISMSGSSTRTSAITSSSTCENMALSTNTSTSTLGPILAVALARVLA